MTKETQKSKETFKTFEEFFQATYGVPSAHWERANTQCKKQVEMCRAGWLAGKGSLETCNGAQSPRARVAESLRQKVIDEGVNHPSNVSKQEAQKTPVDRAKIEWVNNYRIKHGVSLPVAAKAYKIEQEAKNAQQDN